jgi:hypothetical protein
MTSKVLTTTREEAERMHSRRLDGATWDQISDEFSIDPGTVRAIFKRFEIECTPGTTGRRPTQKWDRPCLKCQVREVRSKGLFLCRSCRRINREDFNAPDGYYQGYYKGG